MDVQVSFEYILYMLSDGGPNFRYLHLASLNFSCQSYDHSDMLFISYWKFSAEITPSTAL